MDFTPAWASSNTSMRMPTLGEQASGILCGPLLADVLNGLFNQVTTELGNIIVGAEITPSNADAYQLLKAVRSGVLNYEVVGGTANNLTMAFDPPLDSYPAGLLINLITGALPNTAAAYLNAGAGNREIRKRNGDALTAGDLAASSAFTLMYDGTVFRVMSPVASDYATTSRTTTFTASGTYIATSTSVEVELIAGGGGGGGSADGSLGGEPGNAGGGGGGGGYGYKHVTGLTIGNSYVVTVGVGGTGGTSGNGGAGGLSSFSSFISASGGLGGRWGEYDYQVTGVGGTATGADYSCQGGDGGASGPGDPVADIWATQSDVQRLYNKGGTAAGGLSTMAFGGTGAAGRGYGTGGGGGSGGTNEPGGVGAPGIVIIRR